MESGEFALVCLPLNGRKRRHILRNSMLVHQNKSSGFQENELDNDSRVLFIEKNLSKIKMRFPQEFM